MIRHLNKTTDPSSIVSSGIDDAGDIASSFSPTGWIGSLIDGVASVISNITNGVIDLGKTRNNNSAAIAQTYWLTAREGTTKTTGNTGFYIIVGLMITAAVTVIIINNKKSK